MKLINELVDEYYLNDQYDRQIYSTGFFAEDLLKSNIYFRMTSYTLNPIDHIHIKFYFFIKIVREEYFYGPN